MLSCYNYIKLKIINNAQYYLDNIIKIKLCWFYCQGIDTSKRKKCSILYFPKWGKDKDNSHMIINKYNIYHT